MTKFRAKVMQLDEWVTFQNLFDEVFMGAGGDNRLALFLHSEPGDQSATLLIPGYQAPLIESLSPGGWHGVDDPSDRNWTLLVGSASALEDFGLKAPA